MNEKRVPWCYRMQVTLASIGFARGQKWTEMLVQVSYEHLYTQKPQLIYHKYLNLHETIVVAIDYSPKIGILSTHRTIKVEL